MATPFLSSRNIRFMLYDVFDAESLTRFPAFKDHNRKVFDMVVDAAVELAKNQMRPTLEEMDQHPPVFEQGRVRVHPSVRPLMRNCGEGGWISASFPYDQGGEQLPMLVCSTIRFAFAAANYSAGVYPEVTAGAARLITTFGNESLIKTYAPNMLAGKWQGTMALTEPSAGSSLGDIETTAEPDPEGFYHIKGRKIFISAGDHDGVDNVIHLLLAKIPGGPPGAKGISLFVVPRERPDGEGGFRPNDVVVSQIYHKLGYRGTPITELCLGDNNDCRGYPVGEPHKGLLYMFQMINESRVGVAIGAAGIASAAYYASLEYAKARLQGRRRNDKNPASPQVPIIEHADVKRMLLFQRSVVDGSLALLMQCCLYTDLEKNTTGDEREKYNLLLDILTPVAKTYPSETCIRSVSQGLQCLGGYGYCDDFPLEQYYRDARIHPIHEGTTGIQALDLLGRKVVMKDGRAFELFIGEVNKTIEAARRFEVLSPQRPQLESALDILIRVTRYKIDLFKTKGSEEFLSDAVLYLDMFGIIAVAWQWLKQAVAVQNRIEDHGTASGTDFDQGKMYAFKYFYAYELPQIKAHEQRLTDGDAFMLSMTANCFND